MALESGPGGISKKLSQNVIIERGMGKVYYFFYQNVVLMLCGVKSIFGNIFIPNYLSSE